MKRKENYTKKIFYLGFFVVLVLLTSSCFLKDIIPDASNINTTETNTGDNSSGNSETQSEVDALLKNEDFLETFNTFFYPESEVVEAKIVDNEENLLFFILESSDSFTNVENYYKEKKVQSIWSRDLIFEKSRNEESDNDGELSDEENAQEEDIYVPVTKFTYSSKDKDRIVDVLIKQLNDDRTQIMITYWNLQK